MDDADSAVLTVAPSYEAALIGSGPTGAPLQPLFGNTDFRAYNIDFQNRAVCPVPSLRCFCLTCRHLGELCHFASAGDRYFLCKCLFLWMLLRQLSGYVVHRQKWKYLRL